MILSSGAGLPAVGRGGHSGRPGNDATPGELRLPGRLATFTLPSYVEFAGELPTTATGTIRKPDLRNPYRPTEEIPA